MGKATKAQEIEDAREILRAYLAVNPYLVTLERWGKYGESGHAVVLVRAYVMREWDGNVVPVDVTGLVRTATGLTVRHRQRVSGIAIQSGGREPGGAVVDALSDALGVEIKHWEL